LKLRLHLPEPYDNGRPSPPSPHGDHRVSDGFFGYGSSADETEVKALEPGSFHTEPADAPHFALTQDEPATVYIAGFGPPTRTTSTPLPIPTSLTLSAIASCGHIVLCPTRAARQALQVLYRNKLLVELC